MTWRFAFFFLLIAFIVINCSEPRQMVTDRAGRTMHPSEISSFHPEMSITIGWVPYQDQKLVRTGKNEWEMVKRQSGDKKGAAPVILVTYPQSKDSILLDMDIKNELLGKLIKHSAMTQEPIKRPFSTFFEEAKCRKCHPSNIPLPFDEEK
ncbi:MAG: hypothetical protein KDD06_16915 [Phaeodactylibacter sp.]|nr:hypothetical protein [Phaeodactylibacter sp.]MCB9266479.1 hypothetical protein [Lewinellaceae bacterium]MCB9289081.1 hypothetical protein [Lewinellaceae bacterium]